MTEGSEEYLEKALSAAFAIGDAGPTTTVSGVRLRATQPLRVPERIGRYAVLRLVGRGGMGLVLEARDPDIGRSVALKILHEHLAKDAEMVARFVDEARICGRLEHPGLVPVHEMGTAEDGRPYFTMRLVEGRSLSAALAARSSPSEDRLGFLASFEKICQIVAYAHEQGLVHRDLKPGNVLVGGFGEILVTDWGIASEARQTAGEAAAPHARIVGTPAYMAPEQARGAVSEIGAATDVFALGAILCEILTGTPPYEGDTSSAILLAASRAWLDEAFARLDAAGLDAELVSLTRACLATEPRSRPRTAGDVASEIARHLRSLDERVRVHAIEAAEARTRAQAERQKRKLQLGLSAAIVAAVVVVAGAWLWTERDRAERVRADDRLAVEMAERARVLADRARNAPEPDPGLWAEPEATARQALDLATKRELSPDLVGRLRTLVVDMEAGRAEAARLARTIEGLRAIHEHVGDVRDAQAKDREYADLFRASGIDVEALGVDDAAARIVASPLRSHFMPALDDWAHARRQVRGAEEAARLEAVANRIDPAEWRVRLRSAAASGDARTLEELAASPEIQSEPPASHLLLSKGLSRVGKRQAAIGVLEKAERRHPGDYDLHHELGILRRTGPHANIRESVRQFSMAFALRPGSAHAAVDVGQALLQAEDPAAAEAYLLEAIRLDPSYAPPLLYLGAIRQNEQNFGEAERLYRRSIELDPGSVMAHSSLGAVLRVDGRPAEAVTALRECLRISPSFAEGWCDLGHALVETGRFAEARECFRECHELGSAQGDRWTRHSANLVADIEGLIEAAERLARSGAEAGANVDSDGLIRMARVAWFTGRHLTAARLFEAAASRGMSADPLLSSELRILAAKAAASAGTGGGNELVPDDERPALRQSALAHLTTVVQGVEDADFPDSQQGMAILVLKALRRDRALAGVRDADALARLPVSERPQWQALWDRVARKLAESRPR
jgi:serine/threonine-protein kinase